MRCEVAGSIQADDGHDPPAEQRLRDLRFLVDRRHFIRADEPCLVTEDLRLYPSELRAGLDSELLDEAGARILIDVQGFRLPARAIEGKHELPAKSLAERMASNQPLELADDVAVPAECEIRLDPLLERD